MSDRRSLPRRRAERDQPFRVFGLRLETIVAVAVVAGLGIFVWVSSTRDHSSVQLEVTMRPRDPPPATACIDQLRGFGTPLRSARALCFQGVGSPWYHLVIRNEGNVVAYPTCSATAFDRSGRSVFSGDLQIIELALPAGPRIEAFGGLVIDWYLPEPVGSEITRYEASCSAG